MPIPWGSAANEMLVAEHPHLLSPRIFSLVETSQSSPRIYTGPGAGFDGTTTASNRLCDNTEIDFTNRPRPHRRLRAAEGLGYGVRIDCRR
jgi:hypothetical protein